MEFTYEFLNRAPNPNKTEVFNLLTPLINRYHEPHRFYHNLPHITGGLDTYHQLSTESLSDSDFFAWAYHDFVYDPKLSNNEEQSAAMFMRDASILGFSMEEADKTAHTILSTNPAAEPVGIVNDIDFSFLGAPKEVYNQNIANIRKEYSWVRADVWRKGRVAVLNQILARPKLFVTPLFHKKFETQARKNMKREILSLKRG